MSRTGKPSELSPNSVARALGLKVPGGTYLLWTSLLDPAVDAYWRRRVGRPPRSRWQDVA